MDEMTRLLVVQALLGAGLLSGFFAVRSGVCFLHDILREYRAKL